MGAVELKLQSGSENKPRLNTEPRMAHLAFRMPANSNAVGAKKPRKKPRPPQVISPETWKAVEAAICIGGLGYSECGRKFGISPYAIMQRAKRNRWPVPSLIAKRAETLHRGRSRAHQEQRSGNEEVIEIAAQSWAERGEQHRALTFNLAHSELKAASKRGLPIEDWSAAEKADRMARRAAGLDSEEGMRISIGMEMINQRLETIDLPKTLD